MGKLAIVGLGLIGGSIGLALKRAEPANTEVIGFDKDRDVGERAARAGAVQRLAPTLEAAVKDATLVIVATPIITMERVFQDMAPHLQRGAVVTDTASTKTNVLRWARDRLPREVHFVGGHPMAGKEQSGPVAAEESLFDERPYCVVPALDAAPGSVSAVIGLAQALGARPFFLDAEEHDAYAAAISHLPLVTSIALFSLARGSAAWPELAAMAGPGFYDLTRLASGEPVMSHDICLTNRENILHWLERYMAELRRLADLIEEGEPETLFRALAEAQIERENFLTNPPKREGAGDVDMPNSFDSFMNLLAGGLWSARAKDITGAIEERMQKREREERLRRRD